MKMSDAERDTAKHYAEQRGEEPYAALLKSTPQMLKALGFIV